MDENTSREAEGNAGVEVPYTDLDPQTLRNLVEDLVTRDGTDYGETEKTTDQKAAALMRALERGEAKLVFDLETETLGLMTAEQLKHSRIGP